MAPPSPAARRRLDDVLRTPDRGATIVLEGEAGIGKTTLARAALQSMPAGKARVVGLRCSPLDRYRPFAAVARLVPPGSTDPRVAAYARIDEWCSLAPVVLWVDNAHHADSGSLTVLRRLSSATDVLPLILLITLRPQPQRAELAAVVDGGAAHRLVVDPLEETAVDAVVRDRFGADPGPGLRALLTGAGGNPFVLDIVLRLWARRGIVRVGDSGVGIDANDADVPRSVEGAARAWLNLLSPDAKELVTSVAALGSPADPLDASAMMHRPIAGLQQPIDEVTTADVLRWRDGALELRHDVYGEVLVDDLPEPLRAAVHRDAGRVLRNRNAPDDQVAEQTVRSGDADPELLRSVAAAALRTAPGVAADLLDQVYSFAGADDPDALAVQRATALFLAGRGRDAEDLITTQVPRTADPEARGQLQALAHRSMVNRANVAAALAQAHNLLAIPGLPDRSGLVLREACSWILLLAGRLTAAEAAKDEAESFAAEVGDLGTSELAVTIKACSALLHARPDRALALLPVGEDRPVLDPISVEPTVAAWPPLFALFVHGPAAARTAGASARTISETQGADWLVVLHDWVSGVVEWQAGNWDDALAACDAGLERARETGTGWTSLAVGIRAAIRIHRGEIALAETELADLARREVPALFGLDYPGLAALVLAERAAVAAYQADPSSSVWQRELEPVREQAAALWGAGVERGGALWLLLIGPHVARVGGQQLRSEVAATVEEIEVSTGYGLPQIRAHLIAMAHEDLAAAAAAAARLADLSMVRDAAFAYEEAGLLAVRVGDQGAAALLRSAVELYTRLGATTDLERVRARAHRVGVRIGAGAARRAAVTGWAALTPTEQTVAELVRNGLTNPAIAGRLYVSPRTVQTHVSHILRKTGLRSRVDIAAALPS